MAAARGGPRTSQATTVASSGWADLDTGRGRGTAAAVSTVVVDTAVARIAQPDIVVGGCTTGAKGLAQRSLVMGCMPVEELVRSLGRGCMIGEA